MRDPLILRKPGRTILFFRYHSQTGLASCKISNSAEKQYVGLADNYDVAEDIKPK